MPLSPDAYALLGLTAIIGALVAALTFALFRFLAAARDTRRNIRERLRRGRAAVGRASGSGRRLKAQERATAARAEASERLAGEIIDSLSSGLLVVGPERGSPHHQSRRPPHAQGGPTPRRSRLPAAPARAVVAGDRRMPDDEVAIARRTVRLLDADGEVHMGVTVSPLFDGAGAPSGAICLFTDLTAVKDLEAQLRLKESLATVGELTAGIAHEFRNGLATIHGYSKLFDLNQLPEAYRPLRPGHPRRSRIAGPGGHQLSELRQARADRPVARGLADDLRARGGGNARRSPRRSAATSPCAASSARSKATRSSCARRSRT